MVDAEIAQVVVKFQELKARTALLFDIGKLQYKFMKEELFLEEFTPFYDRLEKEIKSLPYCQAVSDEITDFASSLSRGISKIKQKPKRTEIGQIHLKYRRQLRARLLEIHSELVKNQLVLNGKEQDKTIELAVHQNALLLFKEIFVSQDWKPYIDILCTVSNPVLSIDYEFIGKSQKHKGVVCSWIKELQIKGIINKKYNRQELAAVLNQEIKGLRLGKDGKTFDNVSLIYQNEYQAPLLRLSNLLP